MDHSNMYRLAEILGVGPDVLMTKGVDTDAKEDTGFDFERFLVQEFEQLRRELKMPEYKPGAAICIGERQALTNKGYS